MSGKQPLEIISAAVVVLAIMLMSKPTSLAAEPAPTTRPSAVHLPTPPKGDDQKVLTTFRTELGRVQPGRRGRPANQPPDLATLAVRPLTTMYAIDYDSLADGKGLEAAKPRNVFVYAAVLNGQVRGICHVQITGDTIGAIASAEIGGDGVGVTEGIDAVGSLEQLRGGSYEPRQLTLPPTVLLSHPTEVLWLKADAGPDFIYTLKEPWYPADLKKQTLFPMADFLKLMQPWMDKARKAPPMPPGAGG
jgi:hypothetical protein